MFGLRTWQGKQKGACGFSISKIIAGQRIDVMNKRRLFIKALVAGISFSLIGDYVTTPKGDTS